MQSLSIKDVAKDKQLLQQQQYVCVIAKQKRSCFNKRTAHVDVKEVLGDAFGVLYNSYKTKGNFPYQIIANHYTRADVVLPVVSGEYLLKHKKTILWDRCFIIGTEQTFNLISDFIFKSEEMKAEEKRYNDSWDKKCMEVAFQKGDMAKIDGRLPREIANGLKYVNRLNRYRIAKKKWEEYLQLQKRKAA
jgi:hypothetical protein